MVHNLPYLFSPISISTDGEISEDLPPDLLHPFALSEICLKFLS